MHPLSQEKTDYESWKAAFMSIVDRLDTPVGEKILRLLNSLKGKALTLVKDFGYLMNAHESAMAKFDQKYGGQRCVHGQGLGPEILET